MKAYIIPFALVLSGCLGTGNEVVKPKNPGNEEELITTVTLKFVDKATGLDTMKFTYFDPDGDGGNPPLSFDSILLNPGNYSLILEILDESNANEIENIGDEILEEAHEHQFFFESDIPGVAVEYDDEDKNGNPLGLKSDWSFTKSGQGFFKVTLKHQPDNKPSAPGDINVGATDIELSFPTSIK